MKSSNHPFTLRRLTASALLVLATAAGAQDEAADQGAQESQELERITVTGSRILREGFVSPNPITSLDADDIADTGAVTIGDLLNELPQLGTTFSLGNSSRFIGTAGLNLLDLRRLGTARTLVLVDGRRHVAGNPTGAGQSVDVNTIPVEWIERVDIITGGASAVYGADAVTGVVNFILKDDIQGTTMRVQTGDADDSSFSRSFASVSTGRSFDNGRGNAAFHVEWSGQDRLLATDRAQTAISYRLLANPEDGDTEGNNDGIPDEILVPNAGLYAINTHGVFGTFFPPFGPYTFQPDGSFRPVRFDGIVSGLECSDCDFLNLQRTAELQPEFDRGTINTKINYEVAEGHNLFFEGKYVKNEAFFLSQPAFDFGFPAGSIPIQRDNAYVGSELGALMDQAGVEQIFLQRFNIDAGQRGEEDTRETARFVFGMEGDLGGLWQYESSLVWGRSTEEELGLANRINDRWLAATDAVRDPDTGEIVCRATIDPNATIPGTNRPVPDIARQGCVPTSVFGEGAVNAAAREWFNTTALTTAEAEQTVFQAFATNPALWEGWAGPIGFVGGVEWREEKVKTNPDPLSATGLTFLNAINPTEGRFDVIEGFAEVSVPLLSDMTAVDELRLDLAGRASDYSTIGSTETWKVGLDWAVNRDLRFRGTIAEAIRAPNIGELFDPQSQNFFAVDDPCSFDQIDESPRPEVRRQNCIALGVPTDDQGNITYDSRTDAATLPGVSGGNPNLDPEESDSATIGLVFTPGFAPELAVAIDYWDIEITEAISAVGAQTILDRCVDAPGGIDNQFCELITRGPDFEITRIVQILQNLQKLEAAGVDFQIAWGREIGPGRFNSRLIGTWMDKNRVFPFQGEDEFDEAVGEVGDPEWKASLKLDYFMGSWDFAWEVRYFDEMLRIQQDVFAVNPDAQDPLFTDETFYHDMQVAYTFDELGLRGLQGYFGIDNVLDEDLPIGFTGTGGGSALFDNIGRYYYVGARYSF